MQDRGPHLEECLPTSPQTLPVLAACRWESLKSLSGQNRCAPRSSEHGRSSPNVWGAYLVIWDVFESILLPDLFPGLLMLGHEACQRDFQRRCSLNAKPLSQCWP